LAVPVAVDELCLGLFLGAEASWQWCGAHTFKLSYLSEQGGHVQIVLC